MSVNIYKQDLSLKSFHLNDYIKIHIYVGEFK